MGYQILYVYCKGAMWAVASTVWVVTFSVGEVAACMHAVQVMCGKLHPLHGVSLAKIGNECIERRHFFCGGCHAFANVPGTCPSLTTCANVGLRFNPRWS